MTEKTALDSFVIYSVQAANSLLDKTVHLVTAPRSNGLRTLNNKYSAESLKV